MFELGAVDGLGDKLARVCSSSVCAWSGRPASDSGIDLVLHDLQRAGGSRDRFLEQPGPLFGDAQCEVVGG